MWSIIIKSIFIDTSTSHIIVVTIRSITTGDTISIDIAGSTIIVYTIQTDCFICRLVSSTNALCTHTFSTYNSASKSILNCANWWASIRWRGIVIVTFLISYYKPISTDSFTICWSYPISCLTSSTFYTCITHNTTYTVGYICTIGYTALISTIPFIEGLA